MINEKEKNVTLLRHSFGLYFTKLLSEFYSKKNHYFNRKIKNSAAVHTLSLFRFTFHNWDTFSNV